MDRGRCGPGPGVAQTIREGPGKTCSRQGANHRYRIGSRRGREGNHNRDIRAAYRSCWSDRSGRRIIAFAFRQIIRWAHERICGTGKCRSGLRKVCIDIRRPPSIGGSQYQIVLAVDIQERLGWRAALA